MNVTDDGDDGVIVLNDEGELNCTPRSIEEFPDNYFTLEQRQDGWVTVGSNSIH